MFNIDPALLIQLTGVLFCISSYIVFINAMQTQEVEGFETTFSPSIDISSNNITTEALSNDISINEENESKEYMNTTIHDSKLNTLKLFFSSLKITEGKKKVDNPIVDDFAKEEISFGEDDESSFNNNVDDSDFYDDDSFLDELVDINIDKTQDNIDEEVYEHFPHEKERITIFSKESVSDEDIKDIKELISTIKEEFNH